MGFKRECHSRAIYKYKCSIDCSKIISLLTQHLKWLMSFTTFWSILTDQQVIFFLGFALACLRVPRQQQPNFILCSVLNQQKHRQTWNIESSNLIQIKVRRQLECISWRWNTFNKRTWKRKKYKIWTNDAYTYIRQNQKRENNHIKIITKIGKNKNVWRSPAKMIKSEKFAWKRPSNANCFWLYVCRSPLSVF